ncbi:MAG: helix-turn-helix transcriptional regulator, partial [Acutalibacteraceae bacterium]
MKLQIGENIKSFRKTKDMTQEQLSEMLGVSCQSVSRWESGACYPDMELLPLLSDIFEVTVDRLLGVDEI